MNVLDYIILATVAAGLIFGIIKGFLKLLFSAIGVLVVTVGSGALSPVVQGWFEKAIENVNTRALVSMIISAVGILLVYVIVAHIIIKLITKNKAINVVNRLFGGLIGVVIVYLIWSVVVALFMSTSQEFMPKIKVTIGAEFYDSWIVAHIYKNNFFGNWVIRDLALKLLPTVPPEALIKK